MSLWFKPDPRSERLPPWLAAACLILAGIIAYGNSLDAPFLFDDAGAVVNNPTIRHLGSWAVLAPPADGSTTTGRPVVNASFALNYALSGTAVWSYHLTNLLIHVLAGLTLFGIVRRTLFLRQGKGQGARDKAVADGTMAHAEGSRSLPLTAWPLPLSPGGATGLAFAVALLWIVHPLQTESVTCIAQRTESLMGLFYLLTLYCFIRAVDRTTRPLTTDDETSGQRGPVVRGPWSGGPFVPWSLGPLIWSSLSVAFCLLGMGTKEVMVTAPVVVLLYDRTFVTGSFAAVLRRRLGYYVALAATWLLLAWLVAGRGGGRGVAAGFGLGVSWWTYLLKQAEALVLYLQLCFWPHPLVLDYGTAVAQEPADVWWQGLLVLALLAGTVWAIVRRPAVGFLGACFFLILAPSSSVVPLVTQTMAEHRMYLPLAAVIALVVLTVHSLLRSPWRPRPLIPLFPHSLLLLLPALALTLTTIARNRDYRDALTIWDDTVAKYPSSARAQNNLALALEQHGQAAGADEHFARAVALQPGYVTAHYDWGVALLNRNQLPDAIAQLETAVRLAPGYPDAEVNLGNALVRADRAPEAIPHYEAALRSQPAADAQYDLGIALLAAGRSADAGPHFRAALQLDAGLPDAHYQLALLAAQAGRSDEAEREFAATLRLAPDHAGAHRGLGLLLARSERLAEAAVHFRAVTRLQPDDADAHANLGNVLLLQGEARDAIAEYEAALRLRPDDRRLRTSLQLARDAVWK